MNSRNMPAWHSKKINVANVYHNNTKCRAGNRIETRYYEQGTDGRTLCRRCAALNTRATFVRPAFKVNLGPLSLLVFLLSTPYLCIEIL
jgi:hypothetical protein